jgi:adenylate cyclase
VKNSKYILIGLSIILSVRGACAQGAKIDSLKKVLLTIRDDTGKVNVLNDLAFTLYSTNPDSTLLLARQAVLLAQSINFRSGEANAYSVAGIGYRAKGDYPKALESYFSALKIDELLNHKPGIAKRLGNIGSVYKDQADYPMALEYYVKALRIGEELGDKTRIITQLGNIGTVYHKQHNYPEALDYYTRALKLAEEKGNKMAAAAILSNIGSIYHDQAEACTEPFKKDELFNIEISRSIRP